MKAAVTDKDRLNYADVAVKGTRIENSDESIIWHIAPSAEYWTIFNGNTKSFAASNGTKNQAQLLADGTEDMSLWTVTKTKDASTFEFVNKANSSANPAVNANLRNNGTYGFACYAISTGGALSLYRLDGPVDNTVPTLSVDQSSKVWAADATDAFVVKVTVNSEGGDWKVTPETLTWAAIVVDKTAGTITVTPNEVNEKKTANEATLTVAHASDASLTKEITLKQNGKGGEAPKTWTYALKGSNDPKLFEGNPATVNGATWSIKMGPKVGSPDIKGTPTKYSNIFGWKWGDSKSNYWSSYTLSTDYFASKSVKSVTVNFLNNASKSATMTVKQGETTIGTATQEFGTKWTDLTANTTQGTGGTLTINYSVDQASLIHSITVEYYE